MKMKIGHVCFGILLITITDVLGYLDIAISTQETEKGENVTITATTNDTSITWTFKDIYLASCSMIISVCFPNPVNNMALTVNSSLRTSTIQITALNCSINTGRLVATTPSSDRKELAIDVYTAVSKVIWKTNVQSYPVDSATLVVEIPCVYRVEDIEVNFTVMIEGNADITVSAESITQRSGTGCVCSEKTLEVTKTISYPNEVVQVQAHVFHKSLPSKVPKVERLPGNITFSSISITDSGGFSTGAIVGITVGSTAAVVGTSAVTFGVFKFLKSRTP